jgi:hypothetical protein
MGHTELTYLIGAGASANAIPTIKEFKKGLIEFKESIQKYLPTDEQTHLTESDKEFLQLGIPFTKDIEWLINGCEEHASIDTFARKLYLSKKSNDYSKLKFLLSEFLLFRHITHGIDKRYDTFFATILDLGISKELILPNDIKIITWNYDRQFEFSIAQFLDEPDSNLVDNFANVFPRGGPKSANYETFCIVKLNGSYGIFYRENKGGVKSIQMDYKLFKNNADQDSLKSVVNNTLNRYQEQILETQFIPITNSTKYPIISYSWENDNVFTDIRKYAIHTTITTKVLVIIGYSFPTFNRSFDKLFLKNMESLEKVYIQSPKESILGVEQRFRSLCKKDVDIKLIDSIDEFYIPFEY